MKKMYYFSTKVKNNNHAGSKAVNDVDEILNKREDTIRIKVSKLNNFLYIFVDLIRISLILAIKFNRVIIIQETGSNRMHLLISILRRLLILNRHIFVGLIHDLINLREEKPGKEELKMLKSYNYLISHNNQMTKYLVDKGYNSSKIINIEIFDYIVGTYPIKSIDSWETSKSISFAGNLSENKSGFIYKMNHTMFNNMIMNLYGINYNKDFSSEKIKYFGSFKPEELPHIIKGNFGLVWDGDKTEYCGGKFGNYMKFNNPHKLSFYLASKLPIIIWDQAALADFVEQNRLGFTVSNLSEIEAKINKISEAAYLDMVNNVNRISFLLYEGHYTNNALNRLKQLAYTRSV